MKFRVLACCALLATSLTNASAMAASPITVPPEIVERARAYLAAQVGEDYAARNFEHQPEICFVKSRFKGIAVDSDCKATTADEGRTVESYTVSYRYRPWIDIEAPDPSVRVRVPTDPVMPVAGYVATFDQAGAVVEPQVRRAEAEAKMRAAVPGSTLKTPIGLLVPGSHKHANPVWSGSFTIAEPTPETWVTREVKVDAVTGEVTIGADVTGVVCY
jgi:hypothetical protein